MSETDMAIPKRQDVSPKEGTSEYGKVPFADEVNNKYPIDTAEHVRAAWNYINHPLNAGKYSSQALATIKGKIVAAWKRLIDKEGPPSMQASEDATALRKRMVIARPIGPYRNGSQEGTLTRERLRSLVDKFSKFKRQVPVYALGDHVATADERLPDGWVNALYLTASGDLEADVTLYSPAADLVKGDRIRGASIGTIDGTDYEGGSIGEVLHHVLLTNVGFIKDLNIAAISHSGGEKIAYVFTALSAESSMSEKKETPPKEQPPEEVMQLKEQLATTEGLLLEAQAKLRDSEAANANLQEEVASLRQSPQLEMALKEITQLKRHNEAEKIRRLVKKGLDAGQFDRPTVHGFDNDSDEAVLTWFKHSDFKGSMDKLEFALAKFPKRSVGRQFASGSEDDSNTAESLTMEEKELLAKHGLTPEAYAKLKTVRNVQQYREAFPGKEA